MDPPAFGLGQVHYSEKGFDRQYRTKMENSVDTDEMAHYEPSHQVVHCL